MGFGRFFGRNQEVRGQQVSFFGFRMAFRSFQKFFSFYFLLKIELVLSVFGLFLRIQEIRMLVGWNVFFRQFLVLVQQVRRQVAFVIVRGELALDGWKGFRGFFGFFLFFLVMFCVVRVVLEEQGVNWLVDVERRGCFFFSVLFI